LISVIVVATSVYLLVYLFARGRPKAHTSIWWHVAAWVIGIAAFVGYGFLLWSGLGSSDRAVTLILALVAATVVSLAVLAKTDSFVWLALTAFFAVGVIDGLVTYYRTVDTPKVEPAALLRSDHRPLFGFYVAETSDRVYLGTRGHGEVRMASIPRDDVSDLSIGPLLSQRHAKVRAVALALGLCRDARPPGLASTGTGTPKAAPRPKCSAQVVANLKDRLTRLNRRQQVERVYKGTFDGGGTVKFRARIKHRKPVTVLGPPLSSHSWRFKNVPIHCGKRTVVVTNHVPFTMAVHNNGEFQTTRTIHGHPIRLKGDFVHLNHVKGKFRISGAVGGFTHCEAHVTWTAEH
jgi:hypothetical protein